MTRRLSRRDLLRSAADALVRRGCAGDQIRMILSGNWCRVLSGIWK